MKSISTTPMSNENVARCAMSLGDDFIADDEEHRTGGNTEDDRDRRLGKPDGRSTDNSAHRFDETGQTPDPEGAPFA
jgi:hypothetical protein